jgi:F-type H+-transporting ATPase subunit b
MELFHEGEFWVAVGFVLAIALLLWKGAHSLIAKMLDERAAAIAAELDEAKRLSEEATALLADYRARAAGAEAEAGQIIAEAKAEAARFAEDSRRALAQQIERRAAAAREKIAQAEAAAMHEIRSLAADAAVSAAGKLIAARLDAQRAGALIAASIEDLREKLN